MFVESAEMRSFLPNLLRLISFLDARRCLRKPATFQQLAQHSGINQYLATLAEIALSREMLGWVASDLDVANPNKPTVGMTS